MKTERVEEVANQVLDADKLIHEQQLGWTWSGSRKNLLGPSPHRFSKPGSPTPGDVSMEGAPIQHCWIQMTLECCH